MLIVVAIIAILVAVSIPIVNSALERTRVATDAANERAAKAELLICYLTEKLSGTETAFVPGDTYAYDAASGKLVSPTSPPTGYGKCNGKDSTSAHKTDNILFGAVTENGDVYLTWASASPGALSASSNLHNGVVN